MKVPADRLLIVSFERLVGSRGGGSDEEQLEEVRRVADFLSISYDEQQLKETAENLYGNTFTFRKGQIQRWKREFDADLMELYQDSFGEFLIEFGYESAR